MPNDSGFENVGDIVAKLFDPYLEAVTGTADRRARLLAKASQLRKRLKPSMRSPTALEYDKALVGEMREICMAQLMEVSMQVPSIMPAGLFTPAGGQVS